MPEDTRAAIPRRHEHHARSVPCQISRPAMAALTWAGLIRWQTIKASLAIQSRSTRVPDGVRAIQFGPSMAVLAR